MDPMAATSIGAESAGAVSTLKRQLAEEHQRPASLGAGGRKPMWVYLRYNKGNDASTRDASTREIKHQIFGISHQQGK
jgi:hypothetical protein